MRGKKRKLHLALENEREEGFDLAASLHVYFMQGSDLNGSLSFYKRKKKGEHGRREQLTRGVIEGSSSI